jgi:hypothetical protein
MNQAGRPGFAEAREALPLALAAEESSRLGGIVEVPT